MKKNIAFVNALFTFYYIYIYMHRRFSAEITKYKKRPKGAQTDIKN